MSIFRSERDFENHFYALKDPAQQIKELSEWRRFQVEVVSKFINQIRLIAYGMNGSELKKLFIERWPGIKVCLMSGYGDKEIIGEVTEDIIFIQKPLTPGKLITKLREVFAYKLD